MDISFKFKVVPRSVLWNRSICGAWGILGSKLLIMFGWYHSTSCLKVILKCFVPVAPDFYPVRVPLEIHVLQWRQSQSREPLQGTLSPWNPVYIRCKKTWGYLRWVEEEGLVIVLVIIWKCKEQSHIVTKWSPCTYAVTHQHL